MSALSWFVFSAENLSPILSSDLKLILFCQQPKRRGESRVPLSKAQLSFLRNDVVLAIIESHFAFISSAISVYFVLFLICPRFLFLH